MSLQDKISELIKEEIDKDPMGIGYAGKTDEEIQILLNSGVTRTVTNIVTEQTPISRILNGIGFAPNVCTAEDVEIAKVYVKETI